MSEFKPHDYFMVKSDGYISREIFKEHVRKTYDQIRELADYIKQYEGTIDSEFTKIVTQVNEEVKQLTDLYNDLLDNNILDSEIQYKLTQLEQNYAPRLNDLTAQLQQKVSKGAVSVSDFDRNLGKFDETYMTDEFLQQMAGNTPISSTYADGSVTFDKTSFLKTYSENLIDKTKLTNGYLDASGNIVAYALTWTTDFLPIEIGVTYITPTIASVSTSDAWKGHIYDANKVSLGRLTITNREVLVTNPNAKYVRLVLNHNNPSDLNSMMVEGTVYPAVYIPYELKLKTTSSILQDLFDKIPDNSVSPNHTTFFKTEHTNLIDKAKISVGKYINDAGVLASNAHADTSDFIPVETGKTYSTPSRHIVERLDVWSSYAYDKDKKAIGRIAPTNKLLTISDPAVAFVRIVWMKSTYTPTDMELMMVEGSQYPVEYIPFIANEIGFKTEDEKSLFARKISPYIKTGDNLYGLTWAVIGDSITASTNAYHKWVAEKAGLNVLNYGIGGTSISFRTGRTDSMSERYVNMSNSADIVTVLGGTNDGSVPIGVMSDRTNTTFYGACHVLFKGLVEKYAGKRVGVMLPTPRDAYFTTTHFIQRVEAEREVAHYYGIPVLDLTNESGIAIYSTTLRTAYMPDGLHPSVEGHKVIARRVEAFLRTL